MATSDQTHWDDNYRLNHDGAPSPGLPERFVAFAHAFSSAESGLELACGRGEATVWLAQQGVQMTAYDISPVAVQAAQALARQHHVVDQTDFHVADFDDGLPAGEPVDLIVCNMFRDARLDHGLIERLRPGGMLAMAALSEVGAGPGRFRVGPGELVRSFAALDVHGSQEGNGAAWIVATKPESNRV